MTAIPDIEWYTEKGRKHGLSARCPYATVECCPRYYQSLSLLGKAGSTKIEEDEDRRLLDKWKQSDLWPRTAEYATSISGPKGNPKLYSNFCPEVLFDRFGYFATHLARYSDEIDQRVAQEQLAASNASSNDPRWRWSGVTAQHFSECPLHSVLSRRHVDARPIENTVERSWWKEHLKEIVIGVIVMVLGGLIMQAIL